MISLRHDLKGWRLKSYQIDTGIQVDVPFEYPSISINFPDGLTIHSSPDETGRVISVDTLKQLAKVQLQKSCTLDI